MVNSFFVCLKNNKKILISVLLVILGVALIVLLFILFVPEDNAAPDHESTEPSTSESSMESTASLYIPGLYNTELILNDQTINVEVIVDAEKITVGSVNDWSTDEYSEDKSITVTDAWWSMNIVSVGAYGIEA